LICNIIPGIFQETVIKNDHILYTGWDEEMKYILYFLIAVLVFVTSCEKERVSPDAVKLVVDFSWEGMQPCGWGNPEIHVGGIPGNTEIIKISMYDHAYRHDHGTITAPYTGDGVIPRDRYKAIQKPCPPGAPGRYEITIRAIDDKETVIGIGRKERAYPENQ
jgi:hypothetical protein